jgi:hypothetical protein
MSCAAALASAAGFTSEFAVQAAQHPSANASSGRNRTVEITRFIGFKRFDGYARVPAGPTSYLIRHGRRMEYMKGPRTLAMTAVLAALVVLPLAAEWPAVRSKSIG